MGLNLPSMRQAWSCKVSDDPADSSSWVDLGLLGLGPRARESWTEWPWLYQEVMSGHPSHLYQPRQAKLLSLVGGGQEEASRASASWKKALTQPNRI